MKRTITLLVAFFSFATSSSVFAIGGDAFPSIIGSSQDSWKYDFTFYGRVLGSAGMGLDKDSLSGRNTGFGGSIRIRPGFLATNGNFVFGSQLGTDIYWGSIGNITGSNGSNHFGYGTNGNAIALQIRKFYLGYLWDSGFYTSWGIQDMALPYFNADPGAGVVAGWKDDKYDVSLYYYQLTAGSVYHLADQGSLFGAKAEIAPVDGLHITPYLMGLAQGSKMGLYDGTPPTADSINYYDGAKFVGGVGMYAGVALNYTSPFGLYLDLKTIYLYGKNKSYIDPNDLTAGRVNQTRNAFGGMLSVGYSLEEIINAFIFVDLRTGSKKDVGSASGSNHSLNGGIIEYDANTPPLLIMYNYGDGRQGYQYTKAFSDGYAFSDRGITSLGVNATVTLAMFDLGVSLGYGWYAAPRPGNASGIGFEADLFAAYNMMKGTSLYIQTGLMAPSQGVKDEITAEKGSGLRSQMPWMINFGMKYSV